jgi:hypothetical protein
VPVSSVDKLTASSSASSSSRFACLKLDLLFSFFSMVLVEARAPHTLLYTSTGASAKIHKLGAMTCSFVLSVQKDLDAALQPYFVHLASLATKHASQAAPTVQACV